MTSALGEPAAARGAGVYVDGVLAGGAALRAIGDGGVKMTGAAAACVNCHRRSGLGSYEGSVLIPPIIGPYLFRDRATNTLDLALPHVPGFTPNLLPYDDRSLALALRTGAAPGGRTLGALMPRFALDDASMAGLIDYLRHLSLGPMPGVGTEELEFATIITPDAVPAERGAMLEVLDKFFKVRNADIGPRVQSPRSSATLYRAARTWRLQVWEPTGSASTWERQLHELQAAHPVFAVISGLGRANWAPVHAFCEHDHVPCVLPNVDLPVVAEQDFYPLYYSRGVLLEADLIRDRLSAKPPARGARLVQIYRADDVGAPAASALAKSASSAPLKVENRVLVARRADDPGAERRAELERALAGLRRDDTLALWLRPVDLAALGHAPAAAIFMSGLMADLENAPLPVGWRPKVRMTYPFDPPDLRRVRMNFPHAWFRSQGITMTHELLQTDTYLTCMIVADAIDSMLDSFVPEFLVERLENMLEQRLENDYFPRLSLATGQRFASKGGYLVKFTGPDSGSVAADGGRLVP
jgi:hypothetical protein